MVGPRRRRDDRAQPVRAGAGRPERPRPSTRSSDRGLPALRGVSLDVRAGEILGVAGRRRQRPVRAGPGPDRACAAARPDRSWSTASTSTNRDPREVISQHIAHVPEDRTGVGHRARPLDRRQPHHEDVPGRPDRAAAGRSTRAPCSGSRTASAESYSIAAPSVDTEARLLSGGNLQRLILAREIASAPRLLVAVQPTRGLDVGAIATVHRLLLEQREAGSATILLSEDLDEVLALVGPDRGHLRGPDRRPRSTPPRPTWPRSGS